MTAHVIARTARLAATAVGLYLLTLLAVSVTSRDVVLEPGDTTRFCGLYLDCHRTVSVRNVAYAPELGGRHARGTFVVVTLELASDARGVVLRSGHIDAELRDADGRVWHRDRDTERTVMAGGLPDVPLRPGRPIAARIVFDVPNGIASPRLRIRDDDPIARVGEFLLLGDADSMGHARTWFTLPAPAVPQRSTVPLCAGPFGCDTAVRILDVSRQALAGRGTAAVPADGVFYVVTLEIVEADSGAPAAAPIEAEVRDAAGRSWRRASDAEALLDSSSRPGVIRLAFDVPDTVTAPTLEVRRAGLLGRLLGPARLALPAPARASDL